MTDLKPRFRKLMWFCIGFSAAVLFIVLSYTYSKYWLIGAAAVFAASAALFLLKYRGIAVAVGLGLAAAVLTFFAHHFLVEAPTSRMCDNLYHDVIIRCEESAQGFSEYGKVQGSLVFFDGKKSSGRVVLFVEDGSPEYKPGDLVLVRAIASLNPKSGYLSQQGIYLTFSSYGRVFTLKEGSHSLRSLASCVSSAIKDRITELYPDNTAALLTALLCGDRELMNPQLKQVLKKSGTYHVTAVSGLHVSIISMFFVFALGKKKGSIVSLAALPVYAFLVGMPPSVIRAVIMSASAVAAFLAGRDYDSLTSLFAALAAIIALNPWSILSPGLILSFSSTLGIILFASKIQEQIVKRLPKKINVRLVRTAAASFAVSVSALVFSLPISMLMFSKVSAVSVFSNVLGVWAIGIFMILGASSLLVSVVFMPAARLIAAPASLLASGFLALMKAFAGLPMSVMGRGGVYLAVITAASAGFIVLGLGKRKWASGALLYVAAVLTCALASWSLSSVVQTVSVSSVNGGCAVMISGAGSSVFIGCDSEKYIYVDEFEDIYDENCESLVLLNGKASTAALSALCGKLAPSEVFAPFDRIVWPDRQTVYEGAGCIAFSNCTVELLPDGRGNYGAHITCAAGSVLDLCGTYIRGVGALNQISGADAVIIDSGCVKYPKAWELILELADPDTIIVADTDGFSDYTPFADGREVVRLSEDSFSLFGKVD